MDKLLELAATCEAAEGPDRELDARIWCALNDKKYVDHWFSDHLDCTQAEFTEPPRRSKLVTRAGAVKPWTASIDAAMTLVPEGWEWHCGRHSKTGRHPRTGIKVDGGGVAYCVAKGEPICAMAATPALALCAAALKARSHTEGGD